MDGLSLFWQGSGMVLVFFARVRGWFNSVLARFRDILDLFW